MNKDNPTAEDFLKGYFKGYNLNDLDPDHIVDVMVAYSYAHSPFASSTTSEKESEDDIIWNCKKDNGRIEDRFLVCPKWCGNKDCQLHPIQEKESEVTDEMIDKKAIEYFPEQTEQGADARIAFKIGMRVANKIAMRDLPKSRESEWISVERFESFYDFVNKNYVKFISRYELIDNPEKGNLSLEEVYKKYLKLKP